MYYIYAYLRNDGTPYYIGKGKDYRAWDVSSHRNTKSPKDKTKIVIMESNLTEIGALALERFYIRWYGRKDLKTGILRNLTDGGEGTSGIYVTEETRKKMSLSQTGIKHSLKRKQKNSEAQRGKKLSDEHKKKIGKASGKSRKGIIFSESHLKAMSEAQKIRWQTIGRSKQNEQNA
jgi:hypothetical protein